MYGSNTRGFAAAAITGGLIGVSGTAAGLRPVPPSMPLSPTRPENREPAAPGGRHDSESAVNRIADAGVGAADGRSMQVDFDQQVPRELGHRPPFAPETSGAGNPGGPGGQQRAGGPGVQPGFPRAAGPQQSLFGAAGPGAQFGGQSSCGGQPGQSQPSDAQRFGGQRLGGQLGPAQSGQPQSGSRHVEPMRSGPVRTGQQFGAAHSSAQQPYQGAAATVAIPATSAIPAASATVAIPATSVTAADSATVALAAQRPVPPGPLGGPGGAQPNSAGSGQYSSPSPLDRTYELPADERGSRSDCAADLMGGPVRFAEPDFGVARPSMNGPVGSIDDPVDGLETRTGSHRAYSGADGYRSVADLVTATGGGRPIVGSGGRRARPEQPEISGGPRSVPDMSAPPEYPSDPDLSGSGGYPSATHLVGTVEYRSVSGGGGSGGRRRAPEPMGSSLGTGGYRAVSAQPVDHRAEHGTGAPHSAREVAGTGGYRPVPDRINAAGMDAAGIGGTASVARPVSDSAPGTPGPVEGRLRTSFDAYGRVAPEVEFGRSERRPERSGMFIDRAVESSLPTAAVLSQRFSTGGTGGYRAVEPVPEAGERHLVEPRFPRHDTVEPLDAAGRSDRGGGSDRQESSSALGSLDSSGLFGSLSSRER
jgi:hypothetical protein